MPWLDYFLDKNPLIQIGPPTFSSAAKFSFNELGKRLRNTVKDASEIQDFLSRFIQLKYSFPALIDDEQVIAYLMINVGWHRPSAQNFTHYR